MEVISRVDQPTECCAPMVVTPKTNGEVRTCVDLIRLNQSVLREAYPLPSADFTLGKLSKSKVFSNTLIHVIDSLPTSDKKAQEGDEVCKKIKQYCLEGWPDKHAVPDAVNPYWRERGKMTVVQGLIMKGTRILTPSHMRLDVLDKIHQGHLGISKCRERAKQSVWWPGLSNQIQYMVQSCRTCANHQVNRPEPLSPTLFPERPWQTLAIDFFKYGNVDYLLIVDYFSRYVEVCAMHRNKTAIEVCKSMKSIFSRYGIPEKVKSDNGPPFSSAEYLHFANEWGSQPQQPKYPQSNGEVERAVQTVKRLLKKEKDKEMALLASLSCGYSPAELLMGLERFVQRCQYSIHY